MSREKAPYRSTLQSSESDCPKRAAVIDALLKRKQETAAMLARHGVRRHGVDCPKIAPVAEPREESEVKDEGTA